MKPQKTISKLLFTSLLSFFALLSFAGKAQAAIVINAGNNIQINQGQAAAFSAYVSDTNGYAITYSWSCTGGNLSAYNILNPTYSAPLVPRDTTYVCTLAAYNSQGVSAASSLNILVKNTSSSATYVSVNAGNDLHVDDTSAPTINATASDSSGSPLTYHWSCNGGSLSNYNIINPIFFPPLTYADSSFSCTIIATDSYGASGSDSVNIFVRGKQETYTFNQMSVSLSATPSSGATPLKVSLTATASDYGTGEFTYVFSCEDNGLYGGVTYQSYSTTYTAYNLCTYNSNGVHNPTVTVTRSGNTANDTASVYVGVNYLNPFDTNGISVSAGGDINVGQGSQIVLNGSASGKYDSSLTYYWSCDGGNLSSNYVLKPIFYAPFVPADKGYRCTLKVTDGRGYSNSNLAVITVRKSGYGAVPYISTSKPESVTINSATLKGVLNYSTGQSVRFDWGETDSYGNSTPWVPNINSGGVFKYDISGLSNSKTYHYRAEGSDGSLGPDVAFLTSPDSPSNVMASTISSSQIQLSWNKSPNSCSTMVVRKKGGYPASASDGAVAYYGAANSFTDKNLSSNAAYYYKVYAVGCDGGLYSFSGSQNSVASATTAPAVQNGSAASNQATSTTSSTVVLEPLARNITQGETSWQNSINANPDDDIEFNIIITPTVNPLNNVVVKSKISDKIGSVSDIKVGSEAYSGGIDSVNVGTIATGTSKVITFKAKINSATDFDYGDNNVVSTIEASADGIAPASKDLTIDVTKGMELGAGVVNFVGNNVLVYSVISIGTFFMLLGFICYLLIERKKVKEYLRQAHEEKAQATNPKPEDAEIKKSEYFVIK